MYFYQIQNYKCRNFIPIYNLTPIMKTIFNILKNFPVTVFITVRHGMAIRNALYLSFP